MSMYATRTAPTRTGTMNPSANLDAFCSSVEEIFGYSDRTSHQITEFAERVYTWFKMNGRLDTDDCKHLFLNMAENPTHFVEIPRS